VFLEETVDNVGSSFWILLLHTSGYIALHSTACVANCHTCGLAVCLLVALQKWLK